MNNNLIPGSIVRLMPMSHFLKKAGWEEPASIVLWFEARTKGYENDVLVKIFPAQPELYGLYIGLWERHFRVGQTDWHKVLVGDRVYLADTSQIGIPNRQDKNGPSTANTTE